MTTVSGEFRESSAQPRVAAVGLAHVSVEVGHLYLEDIEAGPAALGATFREIAPWVRTLTESLALSRSSGSARTSTCFLVDDYFNPFRTPAEVVPAVLAAATEAGITIDYLARESACAAFDDTRPVELALGRLVVEPVPGTTGARPPVTKSGWLCNGERSDSSTAEAMSGALPWQPPVQAAARQHSIFVDVQLWSGEPANRLWSCPMLAAVWQLLRLGLLRDNGRPVVMPKDGGEPWPERWQDLPPVTRLNPTAQPFCAYTTMSIVSPRFLPVELAVRTILSQLSCEAVVLDQVAARARHEGITLPAEVVDRMNYVFVGSSGTDPA